jgi:hypothetical protein
MIFTVPALEKTEELVWSQNETTRETMDAHRPNGQRGLRSASHVYLSIPVLRRDLQP